MEENKTIFNYVSQVFATFGIIVLIFMIFSMVVGNIVIGYSSLFELGNQGLSIATLMQLFLLSILISAGQIIFLTDRWIKNISLLLRDIIFFVVVFAAVILFVVVFDWFPVNDVKAWSSFVLSFSVCTTIGVIISRLKEKSENKKMAQALEKYRKGD